MKQKLLHRYLIIIICAFAWIGEVCGQENVTYKTITETKTVTMTGTKLQSLVSDAGYTESNVTFKMSGSYDSDHQYIDIGSKGTKYINMTAQTNYTIVSVNSATVKACSYNSGAVQKYVTLGNGDKTPVGGGIGCYNNASNYKTVTSAKVSNPIVVKCENSGIAYDYYINSITISYSISHIEYLFNFSVTAGVSKNEAGTATATVAAQVQAGVGQTSASTKATFTANSASGYQFMGWGTNASAVTYESTENPYKPTISNSTAGSTANKTLYAIFKPYFNFTVTANKINGDYGSVTQSVTAKVLGNPSDTSTSTQATFTATPNANCTFEGWYEDAAHTKPASADNSYKNQTFKPTITNTSIGSTKNLTLYAWFKSNQTLSWSNDYVPNVIYGETSVGAATATATSGLTVSYTSSTPTVASVNSSGDVTGVSVSPTSVTITASQAGNDEFNAATPITRSFTVISKYEATFEVDGFTGTSPTIHVDDSPTITLKDVDTDFTFNSSDPTVVGIARSGDVITLTALKVGTSTVTLTQPNNATHSAAGAIYNITVAKVPNNLAVSLASQSADVDGTINVTFSDRNNTGTAIVGTLTDQSLSSTVNEGTDVITYANGVITAKNAGTAKITFTQAATDKYVGFTSSTYTITVTKKSNPITITLAGGSSTNIKLKYGATATLSYSSAHSEKVISVNHVEGNYTTYSNANSTITAGNVQGTDVYSITQEETYKYNAGYASFMVRVNNTVEEDGYVLHYEAEESHTPTTADGTYFSEHTLTGPGKTLSFKAHKSNFIWDGVTKLEVQCYYVNENGQEEWKQVKYIDDLPLSYGNDITCDIPESTTKIRFYLRVNSTLEHCIKDIKVTRNTYVSASSTKETFDTVYTDATPKPTATVRVDYSSTNGGDINISSNNPHFVPSTNSISVTKNVTATDNSAGNNTVYICGVKGAQNFTVTYNPDPTQLGPESAVITIGDLFYSQQITLTATAAKHDNTLAVIGTQNLMVDDVVSNVYSSKNSNATLNYTLSREGVITYDPSTNKITAVGAGTATLTFTQATNDYYHETSKSVTVNVSKYDQTISWDNVFSEEERILEIGDVVTTNTATASSGLDVTYSSSNSTALEVDPSTGRLTALDGGANIVITATQPGNYKYNDISITRYFTVIKRIDPTITTTLSEEETNTFPIGSEDITIRCNATITESALAISGDEDAVSITFASNTFTLHALEEGTFTLTLTRDQDEGFNALNKTYTIQVVKPVLVLDPTVTPEITYSDYSSVTLSRSFSSAGYYSIALPFSTTVAALTGRAANAGDWVAQLETVTYSLADGYTLHFNKMAGGAITANQPYILHLGATVTNPTWTDVEVEEAEEATIGAKAGYGILVGAVGIYSDWSMSSNFEADFGMNGKYGIVNGAGGLKRGGSTAKLNAFSAYITPPAGLAGVKVRSAFTDEFGETTYINGLPDEDAATSHGDLYDLSGRRVNAHQPKNGIYVSNGRRVVINK